jgi:hypothetical protein
MPQTNHEISLNQAVTMVTNFRNQLSKMLQPDYQGALPFAETFDKSAFETLVEENGCTSIRAYLGLDEKKQVRLIFTGVAADGNDILPDSGGAIFEVGNRCPPTCGVGPLNPPTQ